jgi:hypothetical protein
MVEAGLRAIIGYNPGNQFWLSGFRGSAGAGRIAEYSQQVVLPKVVLPLTGEPALTGLLAIAEAYAQEALSLLKISSEPQFEQGRALLMNCCEK